MNWSGWHALIPIGFAFIGAGTVGWYLLGLARLALDRVADAVERRRSRVDVDVTILERVERLETRMDSLESGVTRVIELLEAQDRKAIAA